MKPEDAQLALTMFQDVLSIKNLIFEELELIRISASAFKDTFIHENEEYLKKWGKYILETNPKLYMEDISFDMQEVVYLAMVLELFRIKNNLTDPKINILKVKLLDIITNRITYLESEGLLE